MKRLFNFLRGTVTLVVTGAELEAFLNRCGREGLQFWAVDLREPFIMAITIPSYERSKFLEVGERYGCTMEVEQRRGLPFFAFRFRKRYALIAGVFLCVLALVVGSRFVFVIDIQGNETVSNAAILSTMRQFGVKPGVYGPSIDARELSNQVILAMDDLIFFSINLHGTRAEVIVKEKDPKPEIPDPGEPTNVIATATGYITHMEVLSGDALVQEGDTVLEGQVLITGFIDVEEAEFSTSDLGTYMMRADGRVYARTWQTLSAKIPLKSMVKDYTGKEESRYALNLFGSRLNFYGNGGISFDNYDKITNTNTWVRSDGNFLPFTLEKETFRQYEPVEAALDVDAASDMVQEELHKTLLERIGEDGEILKEDYVTRIANGFLEVTLLAECSQQIGKVVPLDWYALPQGTEAPGQEQAEAAARQPQP